MRKARPASDAIASERVFADIDADHSDFEFLGHGVRLVFRYPLPALLAGRAGARPDHRITRPSRAPNGFNAEGAGVAATEVIEERCCLLQGIRQDLARFDRSRQRSDTSGVGGQADIVRTSRFRRS
jgi:hypothetical protein